MSDADDKDFQIRAPYVQKILELEQQLRDCRRKTLEEVLELPRDVSWRRQTILVEDILKLLDK